LQNECFKQKSCCFWLLLQYTWSGILNLIKIIHAPQSISMRVTSLCVLRAALFLPCVSAYRHVLSMRTAYRLITKQPFWGNFIYLHKEDKMTVCCVHMYNHSCKRQIWCVCLLDFLIFDIPKSMFILKNAEMTKKGASVASARKVFFNFVCDVCCCSSWKLKF